MEHDQSSDEIAKVGVWRMLISSRTDFVLQLRAFFLERIDLDQQLFSHRLVLTRHVGHHLEILPLLLFECCTWHRGMRTFCVGNSSENIAASRDLMETEKWFNPNGCVCVGMANGRFNSWHGRLTARTLVHVQQALPRFTRLLLGISRQVALNGCKKNLGRNA
jgi:hypothetical protein